MAHPRRAFTSGNFKVRAQASAVALTTRVSATASGSRDDATSMQLGYRKGMAIFTVAKGGAMYEATLGGQKIKFTRVE